MKIPDDLYKGLLAASRNQMQFYALNNRPCLLLKMEESYIRLLDVVPLVEIQPIVYKTDAGGAIELRVSISGEDEEYESSIEANGVFSTESELDVMFISAFFSATKFEFHFFDEKSTYRGTKAVTLYKAMRDELKSKVAYIRAHNARIDKSLLNLEGVKRELKRLRHVD